MTEHFLCNRRMLYCVISFHPNNNLYGKYYFSPFLDEEPETYYDLLTCQKPQNQEMEAGIDVP